MISLGVKKPVNDHLVFLCRPAEIQMGLCIGRPKRL